MAPSDSYLFSKNEYLGDQENTSILKGSESSNREGLSALPCREIILKSNGHFIHTVLAYQIFNISRRKCKLWSAQGFHVLVQPREITQTENQADQPFLHTRHTCLPNNIKIPQQRMQVIECTSFRG